MRNRYGKNKRRFELNFATEEQRKRWQECADKSQMSLSAWIRYVCDYHESLEAAKERQSINNEQ